MTELGDQNRTNIHSVSSLFVGRESELDQLTQWLKSGRKPIAILGPPGVGKTRLLEELGRLSAADFEEGGVWFIDLTKARTLADIAMSTAEVLAVPPHDDTRSAVETLGRAIAGRGPVLLLFDNFEQLVSHGEDSIGHWSSVAPLAKIVVTTRERLLLRGECLLPLGPLGLPPEDCESFDELVQTDAGHLLVERVRSVRAGYLPTPEEVSTLGEILHRLDGLPLALELAAARFAVLAPSQLLDRLEQPFDVLARRTHREDRHDSLWACIDWSWSLLDPSEQDTLALCSVFRGAFDVDAAESIIEPSADAPPKNVLDLLQSLWEKSLLTTHTSPSSTTTRQFRLLESIADFALEQLSESDRQAVSARHAEYYAQAGRRLVEHFSTTGSAEVMTELKRLWDNLRQAYEWLEYSLQCESQPTEAVHPNLELLLSITLALDHVLYHQGPSDLHHDVLTRTLELVETASASTSVNATRVLYAMGRLQLAMGDFQASHNTLEKAITQGKSLDDQFSVGSAENQLSRHAFQCGDPEDCLAHVQRAAQAFESLQNPYLKSLSRYTRAYVLFSQGNTDQARSLLLRTLDELGRDSNCQLRGQILSRLSAVEYAAGFPEKGPALLKEAIRILSAGFPVDCLEEIITLGEVYLDLGRFDESEHVLRQAQLLIDRSGHKRLKAWAELCLGFIRVDTGQLMEANEFLARARDTAEPDEMVPMWARYGLMLSHWHDHDLATGFKNVLEILGSVEGPFATDNPWMLAFCGAFCAAQGRVELSQKLLETASQLGSVACNFGPLSLDALNLCYAHLELAKARAETDAGRDKQAVTAFARARKHLIEVHRRSRGGEHTLAERQSPLEVTFNSRMMARLLLRSMPETTRLQSEAELQVADRNTLIVDEQGRWFRPPSVDWIDIAAKPQLCRLLVGLVKMRQEDPTETLSIDDVVELLWPDERILPSAALNRVYKTISVLRNSGLGRLLLGGADGYRLDADVPVVEVPGDLSRIKDLKAALCSR